MNAPYNTGKVQIGSKFDGSARHEYHDADALRLQSALLGNARRTDWDGIAIVLGTLAAIGAVAWVAA